MKIKNYKEWDYTLILIALIFLMAVLASCTSTRSVYQQDQDGIVWKTGPKVSTVTGYQYK